MKHVRMVALIAMGSLVSACSTLDTASRNAAFEAPQAAATAPSLKVEAFQVRVPKSLHASEANLYYPPGDIVWRGEPLGNRHAQVQKIFEDALTRGTAGSNGKVPVLLDVEVHRFHALSEKARYTVGGNHEFQFVINYLNPETKAPIAEPKKIKTSFKAFGGQRAIHAEQTGNGQRVRITGYLTQFFQKELGLAKPQAERQPEPAAAAPVPVSRNATPLMTGARTNGLF